MDELENKENINGTNNDKDKAAKFKELAEKRTSAVLQKLQGLGNLANPSVYEYTPEQVDQIITVIKTEIEGIEAKFREPNKKKTFSFS